MPVVALVLLLSAAFGAGDQYLGSLVHHPLGSGRQPASRLRGCCSRSSPAPRSGIHGARALLGLGATFAALVGYFLLTDSPLEGAQYSLANTHGFFVSNAPVILGGIVTGPLFGWFGQQWRTRRAIAGALVAAAALCLEPLARRAAVRPIHIARARLCRRQADRLALRRRRRGRVGSRSPRRCSSAGDARKRLGFPALRA